MADSLAEVIFHRVHLDSLEFGSNDEIIVSRVFFDVLIQGKRLTDLFANVKQVAGTDAGSALLEVTRPAGQLGLITHRGLAHCIEQYFRRIVIAHGGERDTNRGSMRDAMIALRSSCRFSTVDDAS